PASSCALRHHLFKCVRRVCSLIVDEQPPNANAKIARSNPIPFNSTAHLIVRPAVRPPSRLSVHRQDARHTASPRPVRSATPQLIGRPTHRKTPPFALADRGFDPDRTPTSACKQPRRSVQLR